MRNSVLLALLFVIIANLFFYNTPLGIGAGILFLIVNILFFLLRDKKGNTTLGISASAISVTFALLIGFRSNEIVQVLDFLTATFFLTAALYFFKLQERFSERITSFFFIPLSLLNDFRLSAQNTDTSSIRLQKNVSSGVIRGLFIALPLLFIFLLLFLQADVVFQKLVERLFKEIGPRTIFSVIAFFSIFFAGITKVAKETLKEGKIMLHDGKFYELVIIIGSVLALFTVFIIIQLRYLFGNPDIAELKSLGIESGTYSEYVRQGFFELLFASVIASSLLLYILRYVHLLPSRESMTTKILSAALLFETGLLVLSAFRRVSLYEAAHGLTRARIFGVVFLIWLAIMLCLLLFHLLKQWGRKAVFYPVLGGIMLLMLAVNVVNIDGLIATKYKPTVNNEVDYLYTTTLSSDAYEGWDDAIEDAENLVRSLEKKEKISPDDNRRLFYARLALTQLAVKRGYLTSKYQPNFTNPDSWPEELKNQEKGKLQRRRSWQAFNVTEYTAYQFMQNKTQFDKIPGLLSAIAAIENRVNKATKENTQIDRNLNAPLTQ